MDDPIAIKNEILRRIDPALLSDSEEKSPKITVSNPSKKIKEKKEPSTATP